MRVYDDILQTIGKTPVSTANSPLAVDAGLVRLSVGIESVEDLVADLGDALA